MWTRCVLFSSLMPTRVAVGGGKFDAGGGEQRTLSRSVRFASHDRLSLSCNPTQTTLALLWFTNFLMCRVLRGYLLWKSGGPRMLFLLR